MVALGTLVVRDLSDELLSALAEKAARAGISREALVRQIIALEVRRAEVMASYQLRFSEVTQLHESVGYIIRHANGTINKVAFNPTISQSQAFNEALLLVTRNDPGDRERAIARLAGVYPEVELGPVTTPPVESHELGYTMSGPELEVLVRTDGTVWCRPAAVPHADWSQQEIRVDVGLQLYDTLKHLRNEVEQLELRLLDSEANASHDLDYGSFTPAEHLAKLHTLAKHRLPFHPEYSDITDVQGDHFNLIESSKGLPRPIKSREDLDTYMPERDSK